MVSAYTPLQFAQYANEICESVTSLNMSVGHLLEKPEDVKYVKPVTDRLQVHKDIRRMDISSFANDFFRLSSNVDPYHTQWYDKTCCHKVNDTVDSTTCNFCLQNSNEKENCECMGARFVKNDTMKNVSANNILVFNLMINSSYKFYILEILTAEALLLY